MSFTDDNLKRLKEWTETVVRTPYEDDPDIEFSFTAEEFLALLARLEAAEAIIKYFEPSDGSIEEDRLFEVWHEARGK